MRRLLGAPVLEALTVTADALSIEQSRVEHDKQHRLVHEAVIAGAIAFGPKIGHDLIGIIVVARRVEKRRIQRLDERVELVPFSRKLCTVLGVALDQIADTEHESRLHEVDA